MIKSGPQLLACLFSASMIFMTGCGGTTVVTYPEEEEAETVEYDVEETESCRANSDKNGSLTDYDDLDDIVASLPTDSETDYAWAAYDLNNYEGNVLLITDDAKIGFNSCYAVNAKIYTQNPGEKVRLAGEIHNESNTPIKIKDDVIYITTPTTYETYLLTENGKSLEHKDFVEKNDDGTYWGYFNESYNKSTRTEFTGGESEFSKLIASVNGKDGKGGISEMVFTRVNGYDSSRRDIGERDTKYNSFDELIADLPRYSEYPYGYAYISLNEYDDDILVVTNHVLDGGIAKQARFYTQKPGETVKCIGALSTGGTAYTLRITDNKAILGGSHRIYETYLVSSDGQNLEHKDFINESFENGEGVYWGYLNDSYDKSTRVEFEGRGEEYEKRFNQIWHEHSSEEIHFTLVK